MNMMMGANNTVRKDTSETVNISSLALLKMLKHGRAGIPIEVMGLMLGEFVDDYTINVVDVFACPQLGTNASVETIDEKFQTDMLELLQQTERKESVVGWYHSHPGFGCWFSGIDVETQKMFENQHKRCVGVVIDTIQSVKGHVVIEAFRLMGGGMASFFPGKKQTIQITSNKGHLKKPTTQQKMRGLGQEYYALPIQWTLEEPDEKVLKRLHRTEWLEGLVCDDFEKSEEKSLNLIESLNTELSDFRKLLENDNNKDMNKEITEDKKNDKEQEIEEQESIAGKRNHKLHVDNETSELLEATLNQGLNTILNASAF
ncbi:hypothetical protein WA158_001438 [Blastocystis sp. Blastoise]